MARKPRSDSKLDSLPGQIQAALRDLFVQENAGFATARQWLQEKHGVTTNDEALGKFYNRHCYALKFSEARSLAESIKEAMDGSPDVFDETTKKAIGQKVFELSVSKEGSVKDLVLLFNTQAERARIDLEKMKALLAERRVALLEKKAAAFDAAKGIFENKELTPEQREAMMKEKFGL